MSFFGSINYVVSKVRTWFWTSSHSRGKETTGKPSLLLVSGGLPIFKTLFNWDLAPRRAHTSYPPIMEADGRRVLEDDFPDCKTLFVFVVVFFLFVFLGGNVADFKNRSLAKPHPIRAP